MVFVSRGGNKHRHASQPIAAETRHATPLRLAFAIRPRTCTTAEPVPSNRRSPSTAEKPNSPPTASSGSRPKNEPTFCRSCDHSSHRNKRHPRPGERWCRKGGQCGTPRVFDGRGPAHRRTSRPLTTRFTRLQGVPPRRISKKRLTALGATGGCFEPPVSSKNTGERSPSPVAPGAKRWKPSSNP